MSGQDRENLVMDSVSYLKPAQLHSNRQEANADLDHTVRGAIMIKPEQPLRRLLPA
jgi:hypothetical protein